MLDPVSATAGGAVLSSLNPASFAVGVLGNIVARHIDPSNQAWAEKFLRRFGNGKSGETLPPNHDVEKGALSALQNSLRFMARALDLQIEKPRNLAAAWWGKYDEFGHTKTREERRNPAERIWFRRFAAAIESKTSLKTFQIPIRKAADLTHAVQSTGDPSLEKALTHGVLNWTRTNIKEGTEPAIFESMITGGWTTEFDGAEINLTVYKVWCLFLQDEIKKNEKAFKILTVDWLASLDAKFNAANESNVQLASEIEKQLEGQDKDLIKLCDEVADLAKLTEISSLQLGALLPLVFQFRNEVGKDFAGLRTHMLDVQKRLAEIHSTVTRTDETTQNNSQKLDQLISNSVPSHSYVQAPTPARPCSPPEPTLQLPQAATAGKMYGRVSQLNDLKAALQQRVNVAVFGDAGYGKTALAAEAIKGVVGNKQEDLAKSPFPDGVLFLNLYENKGIANGVWRKLANDLAGIDFHEYAPEKFRATQALLGREVLVIIEGGEEADGKGDHVTIEELLSVLSADSRFLLLTRDRTQVIAEKGIKLDAPLGDREASWLFDKLTKKRVAGEIRQRVLDLLQGHPLAITWAGSSLGNGNDNPETMAAEWEADPSRNLSDSVKAQHTLQWLFERSAKRLDDNAREALAAAGMLAPNLFHEGIIDAAIERSGRDAMKQLINLSLLRRDIDQPAYCQFTHVLGYQFARDETASNPGLRERLGNWLHSQLSAALPTVGCDEHWQRDL